MGRIESKEYREFYELAGKLYPEDNLTYSSLSGIIRKKWVTKKLKTLPGGNLLDCGCNIGRLAAAWTKGSVFAIDISYSLVLRGKKLYPEINFIQGDIQEIGFFKPNSIDNAIAIEVIEHLPRPEDFLKGLYRIMKKNGTLLITTPNYSRFRPKLVPLGIIQSFGVRKGTSGEKYLHTAYKPEELASLVESAGFVTLEKGSFEFELRGWVKPLVVMRRMFDWLSMKFFKESKLNITFIKFIQSLELNLFYILDVFNLVRFLKIFFKEGRRTYLLCKKYETG
uniref:Class I SAM-dependent methyltransferase n=1 Tax=candidate division WOR-3 bacterium TaxID=2052148 RepID=A0A7C4TB18_UNCW3